MSPPIVPVPAAAVLPIFRPPRRPGPASGDPGRGVAGARRGAAREATRDRAGVFRNPALTCGNGAYATFYIVSLRSWNPPR